MIIFLPCSLYFERPLNNYCAVAPHVCKRKGGKSPGRRMKSVPKMEVKIMNWLEHLAVSETMDVVASEMPGVSSRAPAIVIFWQPRSASPTLPPLVLQNPLSEDLYISVCIQKSLGFRRHTSVFRRACIMKMGGKEIFFLILHSVGSSRSSYALQPWVGLGLLKQMSSPTSILDICPPVSTAHFPCVFLYPPVHLDFGRPCPR